MPQETYDQGNAITMEAAADLSAKQRFIVELDSAAKVNVADAAGDIPFGILLNKPKSGEAALVYPTSAPGLLRVVADGSGTAIVIGDLLGTDANGRAIKKTADNAHIIGMALEATSASGTQILVAFGVGGVNRGP